MHNQMEKTLLIITLGIKYMVVYRNKIYYLKTSHESILLLGNLCPTAQTLLKPFLICRNSHLPKFAVRF